MSKSKISNVLVNIWVHVAILNGLLFFVCRIVNIDPFLSERAITIAIAVAAYAILLSTTKSHVNQKKILLLATLLFICIFVGTKSNIEFPAPAAFFLFLALIILTFSRLPAPTELSPKAAIICLSTLIPILLIMYLSKISYFFQQGNRFVGFFSSPTTFSSWLCCLLALAYSKNLSQARRSSPLQLAIIIATALLIYASGTRINIIIPIIIFFIKPQTSD